MAKLPFNPSSLDAKDKLIYEAMLADRKKNNAPFNGPYTALMNHPELCQKIESLGTYLKFQGHLARDVYQFVVLAVAQHTKATFEWDDHIHHAIAAGVPEAVINKLKSEGISKQPFPAPFSLAAEILACTLIWNDIPENIQTEAIKAYGMYGYIEIVVLSGFYQMFSGINQGFDIT